jgi:hypothetical protein
LSTRGEEVGARKSAANSAGIAGATRQGHDDGRATHPAHPRHSAASACDGVQHVHTMASVGDAIVREVIVETFVRNCP